VLFAVRFLEKRTANFAVRFPFFAVLGKAHGKHPVSRSVGGEAVTPDFP
jgi:hypothetical protein